MSSTVNIGGQQIGWKYSTPLQAEYLDKGKCGNTDDRLRCRREASAARPLRTERHCIAET